MIELSGCAIINENEQLLLLWRIKHGHYEFPGGKKKPGETTEQTAQREAKEEIGVDVRMLTYFGYDDFILNGQRMRSHKYIAKLPTGTTPRIMEKDLFNKMIWMPLKDYEHYTLALNVKSFCQRYLAHQEP